MKKIFYSIMAVALCACSQSDVDDVATPPQPENNALQFEVVNNGFVGEDGTRVMYGGYGTDAAYQAQFEDQDAIGIFAINTSGMEDDSPNVYPDAGAKVPSEAAYTVKNAKLTYSGGVWTLTDPEGNPGVDLKGADLLFAYAPYDPDKTINSTNGQDGRPSFIQDTEGNWTINKRNNRFFVIDWSNVDNGDKDKFEAADWMGAVAKVTSETKKVTFDMSHMRGMVEVTIDKNAELKELKLSCHSNPFQPYLFTTTDTKKVYRVLTTEYRNDFYVYATIQDDNIIKKYKKQIKAEKAGAGYCSRLNIGYKVPTTVTVGNGTSLATALGSITPTPTTLRLKGTLSDEDWATLKGLSLEVLDMSRLTNTEIPAQWLYGSTLATTLTSLILPNTTTTIGNWALKFPDAKVINIELPASVQQIGDDAFYHCKGLSLRIPDGSKLVSIGASGFDGLKAVYTDPANVSVLKIPATVTKIDGSAFWAVNQLKKIIFQSDEAPTIGENAFANVNAVICVPNKDNYYGKSLFPSKTVVAGPALITENYASPYTSGDDKGLLGLCDGDKNTFWHSIYGASAKGDAKYGQYIDITLPKAMTSLMIQYFTRHNANNCVPAAIDIYTSTDGNTWGDPLLQLTKDGNTLPTDSGKSYTTNKVTATASFTKIRFAITASCEYGNTIHSLLGDPNNNNSVNEASVGVGELTIGEEIWTE